MIPVAVARRLRDGGLRWTPRSGDRFVVADREMDDEVFVLADMTVEHHSLPGGDVIGFNGTTEWALDSVDPRTTVWLPGEDQLRDLLGGAFRRLEPADGGWSVTFEAAGRTLVSTRPDAAEAYGRALLHLVTGDPLDGDLSPTPSGA